MKSFRNVTAGGCRCDEVIFFWFQYLPDNNNQNVLKKIWWVTENTGVSFLSCTAELYKWFWWLSSPLNMGTEKLSLEERGIFFHQTQLLPMKPRSRDQQRGHKVGAMSRRGQEQTRKSVVLLGRTPSPNRSAASLTHHCPHTTPPPSLSCCAVPTVPSHSSRWEARAHNSWHSSCLVSPVPLSKNWPDFHPEWDGVTPVACVAVELFQDRVPVWGKSRICGKTLWSTRSIIFFTLGISGDKRNARVVEMCMYTAR